VIMARYTTGELETFKSHTSWEFVPDFENQPLLLKLKCKTAGSALNLHKFKFVSFLSFQVFIDVKIGFILFIFIGFVDF